LRGFSAPYKRRFTALGTVVAAIIATAPPLAMANDVERIVVSVRFIVPATLSPSDPHMDFGKITENMQAGDTITISPDGTLMDPANRRLSTKRPKAAILALDNDTEISINIKVSNVVAGTGYSLGSFMCTYDDGTAAACDGSGMNTTSIDAATLIKVGATLTGDGNSTPAGPVNGSFDLTVSYN